MAKDGIANILPLACPPRRVLWARIGCTGTIASNQRAENYQEVAQIPQLMVQ
ncbi:MAG: hypothetical protein KME42_09830 [Tildeniella nuda ZEHNDER 1965/U140]|jgi:predicted naringenin-chalcone synthase|nr:hypothetical protein [Tildeniella nuda ZEHNDER 1965/U140]